MAKMESQMQQNQSVSKIRTDHYPKLNTQTILYDQVWLTSELMPPLTETRKKDTHYTQSKLTEAS